MFSTSIVSEPLIRKPGIPKHKDFVVDPDNWQQVFREATWEEALEAAARDFVRSGILGASDRWLVSDPPKEPMRRHTSSETRANRIRLEQRRSLHAPVSRLERGSADGRH